MEKEASEKNDFVLNLHLHCSFPVGAFVCGFHKKQRSLLLKQILNTLRKVTSRTKPLSQQGEKQNNNKAPCQRRISAWAVLKAQPCIKFPSAPRSRTGGSGPLSSSLSQRLWLIDSDISNKLSTKLTSKQV